MKVEDIPACAHATHVCIFLSVCCWGPFYQLDYDVMLEPTVTNPFLEKFYADPKAYALKLQLWMYNQRYRTLAAAFQQVLKGRGVILDRSAFSDVVFAAVNRTQGNISPEGKATTLSALDFFLFFVLC